MMTKIEYLMKRYMNECHRLQDASFWEAEFFKYGDSWEYFCKRLLRKGLSTKELVVSNKDFYDEIRRVHNEVQSR